MAFDPEEMKRKRQQRAEQRARQSAQQRKLLIGLAVAAVVLIACGILIFAVSRSADPTEPPTVHTQPPASSAGEDAIGQTSAADTTPPTTTIHLAAVGDLNITDAVIASGGILYDYTDAFLDVAHLLADADIATVNFEGNLYGDPYGTATASAPQTLVQALDRAGIDLVQLANSYAINQGISGLSATIDGIRQAGMEPLGVYANQSAFSSGKGYTVRDVQGIKIAFVAFTKGMNGLSLPAGSENCVNVLYSDYNSAYQTVNTDGISRILDAAAAEKPDITVALLHWGSEFNDTVSETQEQIVALMQEKGVDAIIGTHPHYVQKMTLDPETGAFVAYSLGDFYGDAARAGSEYSIILDLEITKDNVSGVTKVTDFSYTPIFTVHDAHITSRVLRIHEAIAAYESGYIDRVSKETYDAMQYALTRIEARITGE